MPQVLQHDYKKRFEEFQELKRINPSLTQKQFAETLGITDSALAKHFAPMNEALEQEEIRLMLRKMSKQANNKVNTFIEQNTPSDFKETEILAKIGFNASDRIGFSPQTIALNIQNNNQQNLIIPALFEKESEDDIKKLTEFSE